MLVVTDTKEKPFICRCGAAFTRRDLLTRHQRIALHEIAPEHRHNGPAAQMESASTAAEAAADAAASLSSMSMNPWITQPRHEIVEQPGVATQQLQQHSMLQHGAYGYGWRPSRNFGNRVLKAEQETTCRVSTSFETSPTSSTL